MVIPAILTIFTIIISIWPWSIYSLPEARQTARLKENLEKAKILVDWKIIPLNNYNDIDETLSKEIYEWIEYLCYNTNCENIKEFFSVDANVHIWWEVINEISKKIKVREYNDNKNTFRIQNSGNYFPIEIEWYSKILEVYADEVYADNVNSYDKIENLSTIARINLSDNTLQIIDNWVLQEKINISDLMQEIYSIYNEYWSDLTAEKSIFYLSWEKFDLKLIILSAMLKIPDNNEELVNTYLYMNWFALIKEK
jgi:arginyl-tRNA--protein-N-Asp/Glu arginylyltransferase